MDINVTIGSGDLAAFPDDNVVGDSDGVMIIPSSVAEEVTNEYEEMTLFEDFVLEQVPIVGLYPTTDQQTLIDFENWKNK
ncbi:hypothetical protein [Hyunsoonleella rubra]|uniref:Uncharacterized protein n=1 Tax=Hyunsoonleella rubra TaxID=1737062 RepID=A0ABW5T7P7_9FLAO